MSDPRALSPLVQIAIGGALCVGVFLLPQSCGAGAQRLPAVVECKLKAVDAVLPDEPGMLTVYDAVDIWNRWRECRRAYPDAGPQ